MLRREGLYSSHLSTWRRERGELEGLTENKRGRKADPDRTLARENKRLARENERLEQRLAQGKPATLLREPTEDDPGPGGVS